MCGGGWRERKKGAERKERGVQRLLTTFPSVNMFPRSKPGSPQDQKGGHSNLSKLSSVQGVGYALHHAMRSPQCSEAYHVQRSWKGREESRQIVVNGGADTTPIPIH